MENFVNKIQDEIGGFDKEYLRKLQVQSVFSEFIFFARHILSGFI